MDAKVWIIIALAVLSWGLYSEPEGKMSKAVSPAFDKVNELIDENKPDLNIFDGDENANDNGDADDSNDSICSDTINYVCASGITYDNSCKAALVGEANIVSGVC